jgi:uncharacterized damage-inducible protein DinB
MAAQDLQSLFDYSYWANQKLFDVIARLTPEQFTRTVDGTHGSIRNTMVHVLSAEWGWLSRCGGPDRGPPLNQADFPTFDSLIAVWSKVEKEMRAFLDKLRDDDLNRIVEFAIGGSEKRAMPVGQLLQHSANHGAHHRGQVSLLLRLQGFNPENFDILLYFGERK